jgi:hypothetical protein
MSTLSEAIKRYYVREGNRITFRDSRSLNQLAFAMWEWLGCQQIDPSVLSRVLKGERLFTGSQLKAFCVLLSLSKNEEQNLFSCLHHDLNVSLEPYLNTTNISSSLAREVVYELTNDAFVMFYHGEYEALNEKAEIIKELANILRGDSETEEALGRNMYLKGRMILIDILPSLSVPCVRPIAQQLLKMSRNSHSQLLRGYSHALLSDAYYAAGGYSDSSVKYELYRTSIKHAKMASNNLPNNDRECLSALRSMAASACYIHDSDTVMYVLERVRHILPLQPEDNYASILHLCATLSKALVASSSQIPDPFSIQILAERYFPRSLTHTGIYEISTIKENVETLLLLKSQDKGYLERQIKQGIDLTTKYDFPRHERHFSKLLRTLYSIPTYE